MEPIIKAQKLSVVYEPGKSNEVWALKDVDLEIYPEEYVIFFGPSGSGKSTLLYVMAGLEKPSQGQVVVDGHDLTTLSEKQLIRFHRSTIGIIFQAFYLLPTLTVKDNIALPQIFRRVPKKERNEKMFALARRFGIEDRLNKRSTELSGGQQQRVAAARALINDPKIILADEPVGNLDTKNAEITMGILLDLNQKFKKTIILVTHDSRYLQFAHRVFYLQDGRIIREVKNAERQLSVKDVNKQLTELEKLAQAYPFLTETRLRAKMILNQLLLPFDIDEQKKLEEIISRYLNREITADELAKLLDLPAREGGASLYTKTAHNLAEKIVNLTKEVEMVEQPESTLSPIEEKVIELRRYLLDDYKGQLEIDQIHKLDVAILQRLEGKISRTDFRRLLDESKARGGVGLNARTAKKFSKRIELILMTRR